MFRFKAFKAAAGFVFVLYCANCALATVIYVDDDAALLGDGNSWGTAYRYLKDGIANATTNDEIRVAEGTYYPDQDEAGNVTPGSRTETFRLINGVSIYGGYQTGGTDLRDPQSYPTILSGDIGTPVIDTDNSYHVVTASSIGDPDTTLDGVTITEGNANENGGLQAYGAGMLSFSNVATIRNCIFVGNSSVLGGSGLYNNLASPTITDCLFSNNVSVGRADYSASGAAISNYLNSSPTLINCLFIDNSSLRVGMFQGFGGAMANYHDCNPSLTNCVFSGNHATFGGAMRNADNCNPVISNCVFSGNTAEGTAGGIHNTTNCTPVLTNVILWGNTDSGPTDESAQITNISNASTTINYSCVQGWTGALGGIGNFGDDPLFVDSDGIDNTVGTEDDNFRLLAGSPCIDAGDNSMVPAGITIDLDGKDRFIDVPGITDTGSGIAPIVDIGAYEFPQIYVDGSAAPGGDGTSWATAYKYLQDGLADAQVSGKSIVVAEGTYYPDEDEGGNVAGGARAETFALINSVSIVGGYQPGGTGVCDPESYPTILSGDIGTPGDDTDNSYHVVTGTGADTNTIIDGLTITAGNANTNTPMEDSHGGGMYIDPGSPTIRNCTFRDNNARNWGGGLYNYSGGSPSLTNCRFVGNRGSYGGGMFNEDGFPKLVNCEFIDNEAMSDGGGLSTGGLSANTDDIILIGCKFIGNSAGVGGGVAGGGIYTFNDNLILVNCIFSGNSTSYYGGAIQDIGGNTNFYNCTFSNNSSGQDGGAIYISSISTQTLTNCILWNNSAPSGPQIFAQGSPTLTVDYSCVQGGWPGNNIDADPLFKDADGADDEVGTEDDNLELAAGSPCIDAGDNNAVQADIADLDQDGNISEKIPLDLTGNARFTDDPVVVDTGNPATGYPAIVEMGAYERYEFCDGGSFPFPPGDITGPAGVRDCKVNFYDLAVIAAYWLENTGPE